MEVICHCLVDLNIGVRNLGQIFVRCPALLAARPDELHTQARCTLSIPYSILQDADVDGVGSI